MFAVTSVFGLQLGRTAFWGVVVVCILVLALMVPYLIEEIEKGKAQRRRGTPVGAGDTRPGSVGNPAPGQPDAQADPYSRTARR
jgi:hypothetical protein